MSFQGIHSLDSNPGLSDLGAHTLPTQDTASWGPSAILLFVVPILILDGVGWYNSVVSKKIPCLTVGSEKRNGRGRVCLMAG